jgi:hypothetical protein
MAFFAECFSRVSRKPSIMSRGKVEEMIRKNWLCDITKARTLLGVSSPGFLSARELN